MIRRTVTAYALFLAISGAGEDPFTESSERRTKIKATARQSIDIRHALTLLPGWSQRWEGRRCWFTGPQCGEHLAMWYQAGIGLATGDPQHLLCDFIGGFIASASSPTILGGVAADRIIGKGVASSGQILVGIAVLAPTPTGTLILASRGVDADLPGRFRDLLVMSTLV